jgi:transposase
MMLSAGQMNDQKGGKILLPLLPPARELIADRGIIACIPPKKTRKQPIAEDKVLQRQRRRIEIAFARRTDWRRIATRCDRCATTFFGAITLAAIVIFWLGE